MRLGLQDYSPAARIIIDAGYTLIQADVCKMRVADSGIIPSQAWGINSEAVRRDAENVQWRDRDLLHNLEYGFDDYAESIPKICAA